MVRTQSNVTALVEAVRRTSHEELRGWFQLCRSCLLVSLPSLFNGQMVSAITYYYLYLLLTSYFLFFSFWLQSS